MAGFSQWTIRKILCLAAVLPLLLASGPCGAATENAPEAVAEDPVAAEPTSEDPVTADPLVADPAPPPAESNATNAVEGSTVTATESTPTAAPELGESVDTNKLDMAAIALAAAEAKAVEEARLEAEARAKAEEQRLKAEEQAREEEKLERRRISSRVFRLVHINAEEIADRFNATWSGDFGVSWKVAKIAHAFPEANAVMVTAPTMILEACQRVIDEIDKEAQQVYIEARFVELGNTASHKVGIDWSMLDGMTGTANIGGGLQQYNVGAGVKDYTRNTTGQSVTENYSIDGSSGENGSISYFNGTLNFSQMALTLRALDATEDTKTFSNPKIIVSSGKTATVDMTEKYPNVSISAKRTSSGGGSDSLDLSMNMSAIPGEDKFMFAKEAFFSWGIELEVTPRISTNGLINVSIVPTISSRTDWVSAGASDTSKGESNAGTISSKYPVLNVQRLITEFTMSSGTTAVIGGLSVTEEEQIDNGIPLLRDIPWIGSRIFGSMVRVKKQKEIIVFVTVGLVDPHSVKRDAGLPKNAVLGRQYVKEQKLEPGDRPEKNMEGIESLDMRPLEEQAKDPLQTQETGGGFSFSDFNPFRKDPDWNRQPPNRPPNREPNR